MYGCNIKLDIEVTLYGSLICTRVREEKKKGIVVQIKVIWYIS